MPAEAVPTETRRITNAEGRPTVASQFLQILREAAAQPPEYLEFTRDELLEFSETLEQLNQAEQDRYHRPRQPLSNRIRRRRDGGIPPGTDLVHGEAQQLIRRGLARAQDEPVPPFRGAHFAAAMQQDGQRRTPRSPLEYAPLTRRLAMRINQALLDRHIPPEQQPGERFRMTPNELYLTLRTIDQHRQEGVPTVTAAAEQSALEVELVSRGLGRRPPQETVPPPVPAPTIREPQQARNHLELLSQGFAEGDYSWMDDVAPVAAASETQTRAATNETVHPPDQPGDPVAWEQRLQQALAAGLTQTPEAQAATIADLVNTFNTNADVIVATIGRMDPDTRRILGENVNELFRRHMALRAQPDRTALHPDGTPGPVPITQEAGPLDVTDPNAFLGRRGIAAPTDTDRAALTQFLQNTNGPADDRGYRHTTLDTGLYLTTRMAMAIDAADAIAATPVEHTTTAPEPTPAPERRRRPMTEREIRRETEAVLRDAADLFLFQGDMNGYIGAAMARHAADTPAGRMWRNHMLRYIQTYELRTPARHRYVPEYVADIRRRINAQILPPDAGHPHDLAEYLEREAHVQIQPDQIAAFQNHDRTTMVQVLDTTLRPHLPRIWAEIMGNQNMEGFFTTNTLLVRAGPHRSEDWAPWSPRRVRLNRLRARLRDETIGTLPIPDGQLFAGSTIVTLLAREQAPLPAVTPVPEPVTAAPPPDNTPPPPATENLAATVPVEAIPTTEQAEQQRRIQTLIVLSRLTLQTGDPQLHFAARLALEANTTTELGRQFQREVLSMLRGYDATRIANTEQQEQFRTIQRSITDGMTAREPGVATIGEHLQNERVRLSQRQIAAIDSHNADYYSVITDVADHDFVVLLDRLWPQLMRPGTTLPTFFHPDAMAKFYRTRELHGREKKLQQEYRKRIRQTTFGTVPVERAAFTETLLSLVAFEQHPPPAAAPEPARVEPVPPTVPDTSAGTGTQDAPVQRTEPAGTTDVGDRKEPTADTVRLAETVTLPQVEAMTPVEQQELRTGILRDIARLALQFGDQRLFYFASIAAGADLQATMGAQLQREVLALLRQYPLDRLPASAQRTRLEQILAGIPPALTATPERTMSVADYLWQSLALPSTEETARHLDEVAARSHHTSTDYLNTINKLMRTRSMGGMLTNCWTTMMGGKPGSTEAPKVMAQFFNPADWAARLGDPALAQRIGKVTGQFRQVIQQQNYKEPPERTAFAELLMCLMNARRPAQIRTAA